MNDEPMKNPVRTFSDEYDEKIAPKLQQIDMLLKLGEFPLKISQVSKVLDLSNDEIVNIAEKFVLSEFDKAFFFIIMQNGTSNICRLLARELDRGSPQFYKASDVAYIYGIELDTVEKAFRKLAITETAQSGLYEIFANIGV